MKESQSNAKTGIWIHMSNPEIFKSLCSEFRTSVGRQSPKAVSTSHYVTLPPSERLKAFKKLERLRQQVSTCLLRNRRYMLKHTCCLLTGFQNSLFPGTGEMAQQ